MFDNANIQENSTHITPSSGLILHLDLANRQVSRSQRMIQQNDTVYANSQGSFQPLDNGNFFVGYGQVAKMKEFDSSGQNVFSAQFGPDGAQSYRAFRLDWRAQPATPPKIVAVPQSGNTTVVYMSWNGATEYNGWCVCAGNQTSGLSVVAEVARQGFETNVTVEGVFKYFEVLAKVGPQTLATSLVVQSF